MTTSLLTVKPFVYERRGLVSFWRDTHKGNCQDYAWTTLKLNEGSGLKALVALLTGKASIRRAWSPSNTYFPRHAVLHYKGQWIDSTVRSWRASPEPHKPLWPALPLPITITLVTGLVTAYNLGAFR